MMRDYRGMPVIHGVLFEFDAQKMQLVEHGNECNKISIAALSVVDNEISGYINSNNHKVRKNKPEGENDHHHYFSFPLGLVGQIAKTENQKLEQFNTESIRLNKDAIIVDLALSDLLNRIKPVVLFDDNHYEVDINVGEVTMIANKSKKFILPSNSAFTTSVGYYDKEKKEPVLISPKITTIPAHVVGVRFPALSHYDIVGIALLSGLPPTALVNHISWIPDPTVIQMIRLKETQLPEMVGKNNLEMAHNYRDSSDRGESTRLKRQ